MHLLLISKFYMSQQFSMKYTCGNLSYDTIMSQNDKKNMSVKCLTCARKTPSGETILVSN